MYVETKSETAAIEVLNSRMRHYLARFHRSTFCYFKATYMVKATLILFFTHPVYRHRHNMSAVDSDLTGLQC